MRLPLSLALLGAMFAWPGFGDTKTPSAGDDDLILRVMKDELERSRKIAIPNLDLPYYIEYSLDDVEAFSANATLGGLVSTDRNHFRVPGVRVRVGDYKFDNTNYVYSDAFSGTRYDPTQFPIEDNYQALRHSFWLATDRSYKTAVEAISRKRAALKNVTLSDEVADFAKAEPTQMLLPAKPFTIDQDLWTKRIRNLSGLFANHPKVLASDVSFSSSRSQRYFHNSEGTLIRDPDSILNLQVRASGQASDGMPVRDAIVLQASGGSSLPAEEAMRQAVSLVATNVEQLAQAPAGEDYSGPVLFEGSAGSQLFAELLGTHLGLSRKPVGEPGRAVPSFGSELEGRLGSRILPDFITVVDDPAQTEWSGQALAGHYEVDEEGVVPKPITVVEKGRLQSFLLTRQPVKGFSGSNGRARLPGGYGARSAAISNLFVRSSETVKASELRTKLLDLCKQRGKAYGIVVRKMDYPSSASMSEIRRIAAAAPHGGSGRTISSPLLVYRVYPDGKEELVRGLVFRGLSVRSLKDISAVSEENYAFHYLNNLAPFALMGAGGYVAPASVVAPAILFEDVELHRPVEDLPKLPVVPAPVLSSAR